MVEQGTHKPLVVGSNPTLATFCLKGFACLHSLPTVEFFGEKQYFLKLILLPYKYFACCIGLQFSHFPRSSFFYLAPLVPFNFPVDY